MTESHDPDPELRFSYPSGAMYKDYGQAAAGAVIFGIPLAVCALKHLCGRDLGCHRVDVPELCVVDMAASQNCDRCHR